MWCLNEEILNSSDGATLKACVHVRGWRNVHCPFHQQGVFACTCPWERSDRWGPSPSHFCIVACVHVTWRVFGSSLSFQWVVLLIADVISLSTGPELARPRPPLSTFEFISTAPELLPFWKQPHQWIQLLILFLICCSFGLKVLLKVLQQLFRWFWNPWAGFTCRSLLRCEDKR